MNICPVCRGNMLWYSKNNGEMTFSCVVCGCEENTIPSKPVKKTETNADRIRAMTDEELAEFITDKYLDGVFAAQGHIATRKEREYYISRRLEWLQSPAEEEDG